MPLCLVSGHEEGHLQARRLLQGIFLTLNNPDDALIVPMLLCTCTTASQSASVRFVACLFASAQGVSTLHSWHTVASLMRLVFMCSGSQMVPVKLCNVSASKVFSINQSSLQHPAQDNSNRLQNITTFQFVIRFHVHGSKGFHSLHFPA